MRKFPAATARDCAGPELLTYCSWCRFRTAEESGFGSCTMLRVLATARAGRRHAEVVESVNTWHPWPCTRARSAQVLAGLAGEPSRQMLSRGCVHGARP